MASVIFVDVVRVSDVVPKTFYDEDKKSYFISVTACVQVLSVPTAELTVTIDAISIALESHVVGVSYKIPSLPSYPSISLTLPVTYPLTSHIPLCRGG